MAPSQEICISDLPENGERTVVTCKNWQSCHMAIKKLATSGSERQKIGFRRKDNEIGFKVWVGCICKEAQTSPFNSWWQIRRMIHCLQEEMKKLQRLQEELPPNSRQEEWCLERLFGSMAVQYFRMNEFWAQYGKATALQFTSTSGERRATEIENVMLAGTAAYRRLSK